MTIINQQFYKNLDAKIDAIPSREAAEDFIQQVFAPIQKQIDSTSNNIVTPLITNLNAYIGEANAIANVMNPPSDPMAIIPWVQAVVSVFTARLDLMKAQIQPYLTQYATAQEVFTGLPNEVATLQTHFEQKMAEKGWNVQVPSITYPTLPPLPSLPPLLQ